MGGKRIYASSPAAPDTPAVTTPGGVWLPWGLEAPVPANAETSTVIGTANVQEEIQFVAPYSIQLGHVAFQVGTGLAGGLFGIALYSGDGQTKLASADAVPVAAIAVVRPALSNSVTLVRGTVYWLAWTVNDATTLKIFNILLTANYSAIMNAGAIRIGNSNVPTVGGVTGPTVGVPTSAQLRIPSLFFDL